MLAIALAALARAARSLASSDAGSVRDSARALAAIRTLVRAESNKGDREGLTSPPGPLSSAWRGGDWWREAWDETAVWSVLRVDLGMVWESFC